MINIADAEKTGVKLGERPVPSFEQPVGITPVPEVPVTKETPTVEITTVSTMSSTEVVTGQGHGSGSGTPHVGPEISTALPEPTTRLTTPTEPTTTPTTPTEPTTTPTEPTTTPTEPTTTPTEPTTTPTEPTTTPTTPVEPTTTPTTPTKPRTTPTTPTEPTTTPTTPTTPAEPTTTPTEPITTPTTPLTTLTPTTTPTTSTSQCSPKFEYSDSMAVTGRGYAQYRVTEKGFGLRGGLSFEFRTFASHGILFYSANSEQTDFISCYLQDGKVTFGFNTGSGDIFLTADNVVNDGTWKKVTIYRDKVKAQLTVDGIDVNGVGNPGATVINGIPYLYFGGYKTEVLKKKINAKSRLPISACFRGLMWHSGTKFPNKPVKEQLVSKCYNEQQEKSVYFAGINSYMIA
ncbi:Hypothetical predicted protein, partial [Paramuricea clavata]